MNAQLHCPDSQNPIKVQEREPDIEEGQNQGRLQDMTGSYQELLLATEAPFTLANSIQEYTLSTDIR